MLAFLAARATPGVESVESGVYLRSISLNGLSGYFSVALDSEHNSLRVQIQFGDPQALFFIIERIRAMFDLNADWIDIARTLKSDREMAALVDSAPGLRVPGCWNGFELAVRAILGQQIRVAAATGFAGRLVKAFGQSFPGVGSVTHLFPGAEVLAEADLTGLGLTRARAGTIRNLASAVSTGKIAFDGVLDSDVFRQLLTQIPGIGNWTAQYAAMRALGEPDAFPTGDVALMCALNTSSAAEMERRSHAWRPWRSYATMYLWTKSPQNKKPKPRIKAAKMLPALADSERRSASALA